MDSKTHLLISQKILKSCNADESNAFFSLIPGIQFHLQPFNSLYTHTLENQPRLLDAAFCLFKGKKTNISKGSLEYLKIQAEKDNLLVSISELGQEKTLNLSRQDACLSLITHIYLNACVYPVQAFLPYSAIPSGHWEFWNKIDYSLLQRRWQEKQLQQEFREKVAKADIDKIQINSEAFPPLIRKRVLKQKDNDLNSPALLKAMIIRLGELGSPPVNYETVDRAVRFLLRHLNINKHLRVDRERAYLLVTEAKILKCIAESLPKH
ncbi:MAG TPA: hypothetical protein VJB08_03675 [Candidatus Nanoarchaeia archaeon]|nr:hypothetical protein [Candidatus Nanoarchaeia archaeon]